MQDNTEKTAEAKVTDLSFSTRKAFRIDGDDNKILKLDVSDMNIISRLNEAFPKMQTLAQEAVDRIANATADGEEESTGLGSMSEVLSDIDKKMREQIDFIFDADVSAKCAPTGNMYDPVNGEFRFEHIIDVLSSLYANNLTAEFKTMQDKVKKRTAKYTSNTSKRKK